MIVVAQRKERRRWTGWPLISASTNKRKSIGQFSLALLVTYMSATPLVVYVFRLPGENFMWRKHRGFCLLICVVCAVRLFACWQKRTEKILPLCLLPVLSDCLHIDRRGQRRFYLFVCYLCCQIVCMLTEEDREGLTCLFVTCAVRLFACWQKRTEKILPVCYLCCQIVCMLTEKDREDFTCLFVTFAVRLFACW